MLRSILTRLRIKFAGSAPIVIFGARFVAKKRHYQLRRMFSIGPQAVLRKTLQLCTSETLFIDIGANVGIFSIVVAARSGARVFAFEPIPSTFSDFVENISRNPDLDITPFNIALSDRHGDLDMVAEPASGINRVVVGAGLDEAKAEGLPVRKIPAIPLDVMNAMLPADRVERIVVKIDVERHESAVLRGGLDAFLKRPEAMVICIEIDQDSTEISDILHNVGFAELEHLSEPGDRFYANRAFIESTGT